MLKVYFLLCIFALSSTSRGFLSGSRRLKELSILVNSFQNGKERTGKSIENSSGEDPYKTCSGHNSLGRSMNLSDPDFEANTPLLLVKVGIENETHFILTQEILCNDLSQRSESASNFGLGSTKWLGLKLQTGGLKQSEEYLELKQNEVLYVAGNTSAEILLVRTEPHVDGHYVLYDENIFGRIVRQLELQRSAIPHLIRTEMLTDYFNFAGLGLRDYGPFFNLSSNLINSEEDPSLFEWWAFLTIFQVIGNQHRLQTHPLFLRANELFESKINSRFSVPEFNQQLEFIAQQTGQAWPWPCLHFDSHCRDRMKEGLNFWKSNLTQNVTSIKEKFGVISGYSTECLIVSAGGRDAFDFMMEKAEKGEVSFQALGCATEPEVVKLLLGKIINPNDENFQSPNVRKKVWAYYVAFNKGVGSLKFIRENLASFEALYGEDALVNNVLGIIPWISSKEQMKEVQEFIQLHKITQSQTFAFTILHEFIEEAIADMETEWRRKAILQWLTQMLEIPVE
ncbi:Aminopeptidase N [Orchesella cincta]|uniref:Aminopeptidase N n=1 Tax=Orchesella cincta TaxID=48709 RepID=A0A1D2M8I4_ORCCI|nr:Aminopeptidase N [Orchesella cincta]